MLAGLETQRPLKQKEACLRSRNGSENRIGVGLNGITKEYGADIMVEEETKKAIPEAFFREMFYRKQDWDMAELRLLRLKTMAPGAHLYDLFLERIAVPRGYPPGPDWDGAFTFQTK